MRGLCTVRAPAWGAPPTAQPPYLTSSSRNMLLLTHPTATRLSAQTMLEEAGALLALLTFSDMAAAA
ncbi:hypothetical protein EON66_05225 [archaeon]|nr:MAG: hypothetical protein EON66_05225 [archaeon]